MTRILSRPLFAELRARSQGSHPTRSIRKMSYYHGLISSRRANSLLNPRNDGSFLIRDSQSQPGCFVLSAKSGGRMYHVLIFQQEGKYYLDTDNTVVGDSSESVDGAHQPEPTSQLAFDSLDDLVVFLVGHEMKVEGDDVHLQEVVICADDQASTLRISSNAGKRQVDEDDSDTLTDLFATLFGPRCIVICTAHSKLSVDGQPRGGGKEYLAIIAKDGEKKGFFIRIVDKEERCIVSEKKIGKSFQYDMPGDLVMTYLAEHGITCIGFRDVREKDRFLHQVDRITKLQQDRSTKLRSRADSEPREPVKKPSEVTQRIKASDFDIGNITPEWQYLFDQAGVTREMLEDRGTLQFILDTVYKLGGAPQKLNLAQEETDGASANGSSSGADEKLTERMKVLALDSNLKEEAIKASKLSDELAKQSLKQPSTSPPPQRAHICPYLALCERYKDHLIVKYALIAHGPDNAICVCERCAAGKMLMQISGFPPQQYTLPVGWCQFILKSQSHSMAQKFFTRWHVAYCSVPTSRVKEVIRTGQLVHADWTGEVKLSPDIQCAQKIVSISPTNYYDQVTGKDYRVSAAFQVYIQPDTYTVHVSETLETSVGSAVQSLLEWRVIERTYIVHSLLIQMIPVE